MSKFISLKAAGLMDSYDSQIHGEEPLVTVDEKKDSIEISYIFPGFSMSDDDQEVEGKSMPFKEVGVSGAGFLSESGKPLMPSFGRFVQIPPGCDYEVLVKESKPVKFEQVLVTPAQEEATDSDSDSGDYEYDPEAYAEDKFYPKSIVEVSEPQNLDGYRVLTIHVRPLQYNPAKQLLRGYSNITVTLKLEFADEVDDDDVAQYLLQDAESDREGFGNLVLNPKRRIDERSTLSRDRRVPMPARIQRGPEFLIIYDDKLKKAAEKLEQWKELRGLRTDIVSIKKVGNSVAKIKTYIRKRRRLVFSRLRYVLLMGDVSNIVTEQLSNTTDHYYYTSQDAANASDCRLPWVSGGRMPVNSLEEAMAVVDQVIRYEKNPACDPDYYRRMTFAAYFQDDSPQDNRANRAYMKTMEGIRDHMVSIGFDVDRVYVSNNPNPQEYKDGTPVPAEVKAAIVDDETATDMLVSDTSEGQLVIGHRDHGSTQGWAEPPFRKTHLEGILSQYQSIFYSINCLTGKFDANPTDSFAETIMEMNGGPPSLVAATELSGTWRNDSLMKGLFDALWPGVIAAFPGVNASYAVKYNRLGDILNYAKSYLLVAHGTNGGVKGHFEMYHVIGDPTLQLWSRRPRSVSLNASVLNRILRIRLSSCPKGSVVSVWYRGKLVKRMSPSSTRITIRLRDLLILQPWPSGPLLRFPLLVSFAAPGCRYVEKRLRLR